MIIYIYLSWDLSHSKSFWERKEQSGAKTQGAIFSSLSPFTAETLRDTQEWCNVFILIKCDSWGFLMLLYQTVFFFFSPRSQQYFSKLYTLGKFSIVWFPLTYPLHVIIEPCIIGAVRVLVLYRKLLLQQRRTRGIESSSV